MLRGDLNYTKKKKTVRTGMSTLAADRGQQTECKTRIKQQHDPSIRDSQWKESSKHAVLESRPVKGILTQWSSKKRLTCLMTQPMCLENKPLRRVDLNAEGKKQVTM